MPLVEVAIYWWRLLIGNGEYWPLVYSILPCRHLLVAPIDWKPQGTARRGDRPWVVAIYWWRLLIGNNVAD